jgi:hypothetical protein
LSPKLPSTKTGSVPGSGPGGRVEIGDIRAKLVEIRGEADEKLDKAKPLALYAAIGGALLAVGLAFVLGKRRGRRKATWVEIRRL